MRNTSENTNLKKIAFFDTKPYDRESFDRINARRYDIRYFETRLTAAALPLAEGCDAACAFVNAETLKAVRSASRTTSVQDGCRFSRPPWKAAQSHTEYQRR